MSGLEHNFRFQHQQLFKFVAVFGYHKLSWSCNIIVVQAVCGVVHRKYTWMKCLRNNHTTLQKWNEKYEYMQSVKETTFVRSEKYKKRKMQYLCWFLTFYQWINFIQNILEHEHRSLLGKKHTMKTEKNKITVNFVTFSTPLRVRVILDYVSNCKATKLQIYYTPKREEKHGREKGEGKEKGIVGNIN